LKRRPQTFCRRWCHSREREGFTLVELILTVAVAGVLLGSATILVKNTISKARLSNAASRALSDIRYAQQVAMTQGREVDVFVYPSSNRYEIKYRSDGTYVTSAFGENLIVQMNQGDYEGVPITSSALGGQLSFTTTGEPLIKGNRFEGEKSVMSLDSKKTIFISPSGYSYILNQD
jgi:prepilin-type N-terminal cleavage/methylation domain-containing protein